MRAHLDWGLGDYLASIAVNYTGSYRNVGSTAANAVTENQYFVYSGGGDVVKANVTVDLHVGYSFHTTYSGDDLLSLTVRNAFNTYPPYFNGSNANGGYGYDAFVASPIGRIIEIGLTTKF